MPITFKTRAHADVTMFSEVSLKLIKLMGRSETVPSAINSEDIPQALALLRAGILGEHALAIEQAAQANENEEEPQVSLHNRALPLIDLLNAARDDNASVMWVDAGHG